MSMLPVGFGASGDYTIEESLRFNASQSSYLSWTPASAGNRQTWTFSAWVKRGQLGTTQQLFYAKDGTNYVLIGFTTNNQLQIQLGTPRRRTVRVFRDPSAWYHIVGICDTTDATGDDRLQLWVNGVRETSFDEDTDPTLNANYTVNNTVQHNIGRGDATHYSDGYITEVNFIDGQALDPSSFGETDATTGVWKPKEYTGTYGTNGFYLPMKLDNTTEGFNTVTYLGTGSKQQISGVGFSPDLVWIKRRNAAYDHDLFDSVRGAGLSLYSSTTSAEGSGEGQDSFDTDGFTVSGNHNRVNVSGGSFVAWCWDAGSSTVSNTDGSITSSVRANPTYGFSVVSYTGNGTAGATVGHGLSATPSVLIVKPRSIADNWNVYHASNTAQPETDVLYLNLTNATSDNNTIWNDTAPTSSVFSIGSNTGINTSGGTYIAYCFSEVSGYSKFGSYTGTGASGNVVTTGFKPAFVMIKRTDAANSWHMFDTTRDTDGNMNKYLYAQASNAEGSDLSVDVTDTGFSLISTTNGLNASGGTYIYMAFKDTREYAFWLDDSGNNNDWQPNGGITTSSTVTDTPTPYLGGGNYAVLNPTFAMSGVTTGATIVDGNLKKTTGENSYAVGSMAMSSGLWYWEVTVLNAVPGNIYLGMLDSTSASFVEWRHTGTTSGTTSTPTLSSYTLNDTLSFAYDADNNRIYYGKNGTWQNSAVPSSGTGFLTPITTEPKFPSGRSQSTQHLEFNFGQRPFAYTPPTGFLPLHTGNLPDSSIVDGSKHFDALLYTGDQTTGRAITGLEFQPDFVWAKARNNAQNHTLYNSVVGATKYLNSNTTTAESTNAETLQSFDSNGFTLGNAFTNESGYTYVAWNWKANGTGVSNTDGSITSTVSANPTAGFSVVTATLSGTTETIGHGLGVAPKMIIGKSRSTTSGWVTYHASATNQNQYLILNTTAAVASATGVWGASLPTSSVFGVTNGVTLTSNASAVFYCFAEVEGYSKFGSYTGNGSADGPFVFTNFRPAFVMVKRTNNVGNWKIFDSRLNPYNVANNTLAANLSNAETIGSTGNAFDIVSNGFKAMGTATDVNASANTYIYMAFAENPFKNSLAR